MLIRKFIFLLPAAAHKAMRRMSLPDLTDSDLFILYSIDYLPSCTQATIVRHAKRMRHTINQAGISQRTRHLISIGLVHDSDGMLSLSPTGREALSLIRRYLVNKRL